jgi:hypothetical protein
MNALADTLVIVLLWTNPTAKQAVLSIPLEQRESPSDSIGYACSGGEPMTDLDSVIVYAWPTHAGAYRRRVAAKSVRGRDGMPDSIGPLVFPGWSGAHFDLTSKRIGSSKQSCESNRVYKAVPVTTGVEVPSRGRVVVERWYDVHGRAIDVRRFTGIAFVRWTVRDRFIGSQRTFVLRGRVMTALRRPEP